MKRTFFILSIILNIVLIGIIAWQINKTNNTKEYILTNHVQMSLVELEGEIAYQMEQNWKEPTLVTAKLNEVLQTIDLSIQSGILSKKEKETM